MPNRREIFCAKAFEAFLALHSRAPLPSWHPVPRGQDPPDFFLELGPERYAVEITSTQVHRQPLIGEQPVIEETFQASHEAIAVDAERAASSRGFTGRYVLTFDAPIASKEFPRLRSQLVGALVSAIQASQAELGPWDRDVLVGDLTLCWLFRGGDGPLKIHMATGDQAPTESPEFASLVTEMLRRAISLKKRRLQEASITDPAILLLLNTYAFATPSAFLASIRNIPDRHFYHSIFLVNGDASGTMLQSLNEDCLATSRPPDAA